MCLGCKTRFASRSAVFRHLKATGCGGAVRGSSEMVGLSRERTSRNSVRTRPRAEPIVKGVPGASRDDARECAEATMPFPGNRDAYVWEMTCFCAQVVAVWCAFLLLPFSNDDAVRPVETHTPKSARKSKGGSPSRGSADYRANKLDDFRKVREEAKGVEEEIERLTHNQSL